MAVRGSKTKLKRPTSPKSVSEFRNRITKTQSQVNLATAAAGSKTIKPVMSKNGKRATWKDPAGASITRDKQGKIRYKVLKPKTVKKVK